MEPTEITCPRCAHMRQQTPVVARPRHNRARMNFVLLALVVLILGILLVKSQDTAWISSNPGVSTGDDGKNELPTTPSQPQMTSAEQSDQNLPRDSSAEPDSAGYTNSNDSSHGGPRWAWTSNRLVTEDDLQGLNYKELELMRNEIYARHGWVFQRQDLQQYFSAQYWYKPAGPASQRDAVNKSVYSCMSAIEKQNAAKILHYEKLFDGK